MESNDLIEFVPEDKRAAFTAKLAEISKGYVKIDGPDIAAKVMKENEYLKSILESETSKRVENHDVKFRAEKLPGIIEEEIKKRGPKPKDPETAAALEEAQKARTEIEKWKADAIKAQQRARAIAVLSKEGLPESLADRYIGMTDEETDANLKGLVSTIKPIIKAQTDAEVLKRVGNQGTPPAGTNPDAETKIAGLRQKYAELARSGQMDAASNVASEIMNLQKGK